MTERSTLRGEPLDERLQLTLTEVCTICGVREDIVIEMVNEGVVEPIRRPDWVFSGLAVTRIQTVMRLQQDLDFNLTAAALTLDLLEEIEQLRRRLGTRSPQRD